MTDPRRPTRKRHLSVLPEELPCAGAPVGGGAPGKGRCPRGNEVWVWRCWTRRVVSSPCSRELHLSLWMNESLASPSCNKFLGFFWGTRREAFALDPSRVLTPGRRSIHGDVLATVTAPHFCHSNLGNYVAVARCGETVSLLLHTWVWGLLVLLHTLATAKLRSW